MDRHDKEALLDRVYELEGLLHLAINREDCPARLDEIIRLKGKRIAEIIAGVETPEDKPAEEGLLPEEKPEEEPAAIETPEDKPAEEGLLPEEKPEEEPADGDHVPEAQPDADPMLEEEEMMAEAWEATEEKPAEEGTPTDENPLRRTGHMKSRFSLNDRFRFSRELFGGDTKCFDTVVEMLNSLADDDEVRDYIVTELKWDIEADDAAAEFLEIITK